MKPTSTATKPTERPARLFHRANHLLFLLSALLLLTGYALMAGDSTTATVTASGKRSCSFIAFSSGPFQSARAGAR